VLTRIPATAPTATMGLAATFSRADARANGKLIAGEARARGIDVVLQPFINIDRDFAYGRGYNTMAKTLADGPDCGGVYPRVQVKASCRRPSTMSATIPTAAMFTSISKPARDLCRALCRCGCGGRSSIMCSYNKINGHAACGNNDTLNKILKDELGFKVCHFRLGRDPRDGLYQRRARYGNVRSLAVTFMGPSYFVNNPNREAEPEGPREGRR